MHIFMNLRGGRTGREDWVAILGIAAIALCYLILLIVKDALRCKRCGSWRSKVVEGHHFVTGDTSNRRGVVIGHISVKRRVCSKCDNVMSSNPPIEELKGLEKITA